MFIIYFELKRCAENILVTYSKLTIKTLEQGVKYVQN